MYMAKLLNIDKTIKKVIRRIDVVYEIRQSRKCYESYPKLQEFSMEQRDRVDTPT